MVWMWVQTCGRGFQDYTVGTICDNIFYLLDISFCSDLQDIRNDPKSATHAFYVLSVVDNKTENLQVLTNHEVRISRWNDVINSDTL